jgi:hypothetical protein
LPQGIKEWTPDKDKWELYDLSKDWSQADDLAGKMPAKIAGMKDLFLIELTKNNGLPIGGGLWIPVLLRLGVMRVRNCWSGYPVLRSIARLLLGTLRAKAIASLYLLPAPGFAQLLLTEDRRNHPIGRAIAHAGQNEKNQKHGEKADKLLVIHEVHHANDGTLWLWTS